MPEKENQEFVIDAFVIRVGMLALAAFLLGWGGISVQFQTLAVLAESKITGALHPAGRLMSAGFGAVLAYVVGLGLF